MSTSEEVDMSFEAEEGAPEMDFQILEEGQEPPKPETPDPLAGKKVLTEEEYQALLQRQDSTAEMSRGLSTLAEKLSQPAQPQYREPPRQEEMSEEELEKMLFQPGQGVEAVRRMLMREMAPLQGMTVQQQMMTNKKLLKLDPKTGELFSKYEGEIERRIQGLPPQARFRPDIYEVMYKEVLVDKQEEIIQDRAAIIAKAAVEKALADAGITTGGGTAPKAPALRQEGGGGAAPRPKKTMYLTPTDVKDMKERMMDPGDPDQRRAYYDRFKKGKE